MAPKILDDDVALFSTIADYRILTKHQAAYVLDRNASALRRRLNALADAGFVEKLVAPCGRRGRPEISYGLTGGAVRTLKAKGVLDDRLDINTARADAVLDQIGHQHLVNVFRFSLLALERNAEEFAIRGISSNSPFAINPGTSQPVTLAAVSVPSDDPQHEMRFIPDYTFQISHKEKDKSLLYFVEADTGAEALNSADLRKPTVSRKIRCYQEYFRSGAYKTYETHWNRTFNGFRLLFLCSDRKRAKSVANTVRHASPRDFIWVTSLEALERNGVSGSIWYRGGKEDKPHDSILGRFARSLPVPK